MAVLPAAVVVTIAPRVEQVVLVMVSTDIPGGIVVMVEIACPVGTTSAAPRDCATRNIAPLLRLELEAVVLLSLENEEEPAADPPTECKVEVALGLAVEVTVLFGTVAETERAAVSAKAISWINDCSNAKDSPDCVDKPDSDEFWVPFIVCVGLKVCVSVVVADCEIAEAAAFLGIA